MAKYRSKIWRLTSGLICLAMVVVSLGMTGTAVKAQTAVFINEIHYDNASTDVGEAVEVAGPAGTDLGGWSLVFYNGNGNTSYGTLSLSGVLADLDNGYGTLSFPFSGIQNGSPDGIALVDSGGTAVQFLCYEGTFTATGDAADGMLCEDIGVQEGSSTPIGHSLQLGGTGTE